MSEIKLGLQQVASERNKDQQELRTVNQIRQDAERRLASLQLSPLEPVMAPKMPPGTLAASQQQVSTNIYGLQMVSQKGIFRYQVTIMGEFSQKEDGQPRRTKQLEFTGRVVGDPNVVSRRDDCRKIFNKMLATYKKDFTEQAANYYYDLKSILFTLEPLDIKDTKDFEISTGENFYAYLSKIVVTIQKVTDKFQLTTGDIRSYVHSDLTLTDRSLQQFLEIAISQPVLNDPSNHVVLNGSGSYFMDPFQYGFSERDTPELKEGKYLALGVQKSVRFVEGPKGRNTNNVATVVETKKTPFHSQQLLIEKMQMMTRLGPGGRVENYSMEALRRGVKGLYVQTVHRPANRIMKIQDLLNETARSSILTENERYGKMTIEQYFKERYNMTLKFPEAPLIGIKDQRTPGALMKFPVEVLQVVDNQRVTTEQQSREQISQQIRACAVLPSILAEQVSKCAKAIGLFDNKHLDAAAIKVIPNPLQTNARMLPAPTILVGNNATFKPDGRGTWRGDQRASYLLPAKCNKWAAFLINPSARDALSNQQMSDIVGRLTREANNRGMSIGAPVTIGTVDANERAMSDMLDTCVKKGVEFAFFVHAGNDTTIHGFMKYFELKGIITQDLKAQTAMNVIQKNQNLTMENIVMKTNVKLGGLNWAIRLESPPLGKMFDSAVLYIGFGANHPGGGLGGAGVDAPPTVVGFAANDNPHPFEFTGDFIYQETRRDEKVDVMQTIIEKILDRYSKNRKTTPKCIVVYRNGCSEGQFRDVISYEIPFIKLAMKNKGVVAKLVVIVPNKLHNVRLVPANINRADKAPEQNVKPGMVIDTQVVHPTWNEFYLCSHTTLQGTAKVPRYTILYDDSGLSPDQLQEATFALAFGYQIVKSPTSLPAPAYIANKYADRGRTMLKSHMNSETSPPERQNQAIEGLNATITYSKFDLLRGKRINA